MTDSFLSELAKPQPDPGGGAASAHGALIGLALLEKVLLLEYGSVKNTGPDLTLWRRKQEALKSLFNRIENLREEDRQIYPRLIREKASQSHGGTLDRIIEDSLTVPLRIMEEIQEGLQLLGWVGARCKKNLRADLLVAAELLGAAMQGAYHIGRANLPLARQIPLPKTFDQVFDHTLREGLRTLNEAKKSLAAPASRS
jgi:formiminotetrahydrofolate cyclodeaminase